MLEREYTVVLDPWPEGGGYTVLVPALPGCVTQGRTKKEALERVQEAIRAHVQGLAADGLSIPTERHRPTLVTVKI